MVERFIDISSKTIFATQIFKTLISSLWMSVLEENLQLALFKGWSGMNWYMKAFLWLKKLKLKKVKFFCFWICK